MFPKLPLLALALVLAFPAARADYAPKPGDCTVATWDGMWRDETRQREIPVRIYYPTGEHAPASSPVILFSHGLGGSRENYGYLGQAWAAHGYVSVHLQHHGSDTDLIKDAGGPLRVAAALKRATTNPANFRDRPADVRFVLDQLTAANDNASFPLHGRLDLKHVGVAGHSFGAYTVMAISGQQYGSADRPQSFGPDPRIIAGIAMSSQPAPTANREHAYDRIRIPIFHLTGTHDESLGGRSEAADDGGLGHTSAAGRRVAYDSTRNGTAYLLTFTGGDHMVFSGREPTNRSGSEERFRKLIGTSTNPELTPEKRHAMHQVVVDASIAFWDAMLRGDAGASHWFEQGGLAGELGALGHFEQKHPAVREPDVGRGLRTPPSGCRVARDPTTITTPRT